MQPFNPEKIIAAIQSVVKSGSEPVELHIPRFSGNEWAYIKECLDTGWVSSVGKFVDDFEKRLADFTGTSHAVAAVNGTAALHVCLMLADVKPGDEVLIPALTFVGTANPVAYCGATPHFVDSEERTLGVDAAKLDRYLTANTKRVGTDCINKKTNRPIRALVVMHTFGHPVDLDAALETCKRHGIALIEDAAESIGSFYKGKHTGSHGLLTALSFNGNKVITTGGGGAVLTNDSGLAKRAKHLTTTAKRPHAWEFYHDEIGYNYRLPNINAALGCAQIEQLPKFLESKRRLAAHYEKAFSNVIGATFFKEPDFGKSNYWLNAILVEKHEQRDELLKALHGNGIKSRPTWTLLNKLPMYSSAPSMPLETASSIEGRLINLPSSVLHGEEHG